MKTYQVIISNKARESLKTIVDYIKEDSPSAAEKVKKTLIKEAKSLSKFPERYSKEEQLIDKPGNYRSFVKWHYKLVYKVEQKEVQILNIVHTSRKPSVMKKIV
ncbi:MAG: type II toxin-antitoxin system RelE/ParE family toxin [Bacteroidota bacterium]